MTTLNRFPVLAASAILACAWVPSANASNSGGAAPNAQAAFNLQGDPTCLSLSPDHDILEVTVNWPVQGTASDKNMEQIIEFSVDMHNRLSWTVVDGLPLNFVVLKGAQPGVGATVYSYGSNPGGLSDTDLPVALGTIKEGETIEFARFCYGLAEKPTELPPPVVQNLGRCDQLNNGIDGTVIQLCPDAAQGSSDERVILSFSFDEDKKSEDFNLKFCTCNLDDEMTSDPQNDSTFEQCDPDATQDSEDSDNPPMAGLGGPCGNGDGFVRRVPVQIMGVEDPGSFLCFAAGGGRSCFFRFSK